MRAAAACQSDGLGIGCQSDGLEIGCQSDGLGVGTRDKGKGRLASSWKLAAGGEELVRTVIARAVQHAQNDQQDDQRGAHRGKPPTIGSDRNRPHPGHKPLSRSKQTGWERSGQ